MSWSQACLRILLLSTIAGFSSGANWRSGVLITPLGAGGNVVYLTENTNGDGVALYKSLSNTVGQGAPPALQSWSLSAGWPASSFTIKIQTVYLVASGTTAVALTQTTTPTQWTLDAYGRVVAPGNLCLTVNGAAVSGASLSLTHCTLGGTASSSQQWVFSPSVSPTSTFSGAISSIDEGSKTSLCIDATGILATGASTGRFIAAPQLNPCAAGTPGQVIQATAALHPVDPDQSPAVTTAFTTTWPTLAFQLVVSNGLCLSIQDKILSSGNLGRVGDVLGLSDCTLGSQLPLASKQFFSYWVTNTRGQLQNDLLLANTASGNDYLPICLSHSNGTLFASDCSFKTFANRWQFDLPVGTFN